MFKSFKNRKFELEVPPKHQEKDFSEYVDFLLKIRERCRQYKIHQTMFLALFESMPLFIKVKNHDKLKEKKETTRERPNTGARHHGQDASGQDDKRKHGSRNEDL